MSSKLLEHLGEMESSKSRVRDFTVLPAASSWLDHRAWLQGSTDDRLRANLEWTRGGIRQLQEWFGWKDEVLRCHPVSKNQLSITGLLLQLRQLSLHHSAAASMKNSHNLVPWYWTTSILSRKKKSPCIHSQFCHSLIFQKPKLNVLAGIRTRENKFLK